jgi:Protein kinase domain
MADLPSETSDPSADRAYGIMEWPRIPGYEIEGRVGAGGMAVVFRAHDERLRRPVALKVITPALAADEGFRRRFIREARAAAMVDHPHIIPVFAAGESDGLLFIAMRFVAGGDVRSILDRSGAMSAGRATGVISAVGSALDAAHRAGLVHRDVKPANMLIDVRPGRPDHVYLSDFGLSKGALDSGGVTRTGHVVGTPAYLAPEQGSGGKVDGRTDQYSLACVAYELLTGIPPFLRDDAAAMVYAHLWEPPPLATARQPSLPSAVDPVLARAMSKDPDQRFLTCQEFAESLRAALGLRPHDADPGMSVGDGTRDGALSHDAPVPAVTPDDRDIPPAAGANGSLAAASPPPASGGPGRAPAGKSAPGGSDRIRPRVRRDGRARTRRRIVRLSVTALALAALTLAGVVVAVRVSRSPGPVPVLAGAYKPVAGQLASVSVGLNGQVLGPGYTCSECGSPRETDRPLLVEQNGSAWSRLALPAIPGSSRLTGASVSADGTIYVVGYRCLAYCRTSSEIDRPLILRWRGGVWSRFAHPSTIKPALLTGVSVTTTGIIFAVGYTCPRGCSERLSGPGDYPLLLRSDGSRWRRVSSQGMPGGGMLSAVSTQPDGNAWAVGNACALSCKTLILRWDGWAWRRVNSPSFGGYAQLLDISTTATSGWASGWYSCTGRCGQPGVGAPALILLWNGYSWSPAKIPSLGHLNLLNAISGAPDGTAWAGELSCTALCRQPSASPAVFRSAILRSNGSDWSQLRPSPGGNWMLSGIAAEPGGGAVAVGHECMSGCGKPSEVDRTVILRSNGSRWSVVR